MILLLKDQWFRRRDGYDVSVWDMPNGLPIEAAAVGPLLAGYLAGGLPGMAQTWCIGPVAARYGGGGGDVGIYMSFAITGVLCFVLRTVGKRVVGW